MKTPVKLPICSMVWALLCPSLFAATTPSFSGIGDLPGGNNLSVATGISADGTTITGNSSSELSSGEVQDSEGFRWSQAEGIVPLGFLQETEASPFSPAVSISHSLSADGSRIAGTGYYKTSGLDPFPEQRAVYWNGTSEIVLLPILSSASGEFKLTDAYDTSDDGNTIVGRSSSSGGIRGVVWTVNGDGSAQVLSLGPLPTPPITIGDKLQKTTSANAISGDGITVVGSGTYSVTETTIIDPPPPVIPIYEDGILVGYRLGIDPPPYEVDTLIDQGTEAFVWTSGNALHRLGDLEGGGWSSEALGVSNDGSVIVGYGSSSDTDVEALVWVDRVMNRIGDLPDGDTNCQLSDVSGDGTIAVGFGNDDEGQTAVIWDSEHGLRKLSTLMEERGIDLSGWSLTSAIGISADGEVITGNGTNPSGDPEAWMMTGVSSLLTPPLPRIPMVSIEIGKVLSFPTNPDNIYQVEYSMNLSNWLPLGASISTVGAGKSFTSGVVDSSPSNGSKFYRVRLLAGSASANPPSLSMGQGGLLSFQTEPGFLYQIKQSTDLSNWLDLGEPISTMDDNQEINHSVFHPFTVFPNPIPARNNYRVEIEAP